MTAQVGRHHQLDRHELDRHRVHEQTQAITLLVYLRKT